MLDKVLSESYELTTKGGVGLDSNQEQMFLKRTTGWCPIVFAYGPEFSSKAWKKAPTPLVREAAHPQPEKEYFLFDEMATQCRSIFGSLRSLSENRWDLQFATRKLSRRLSKPTNHAWNQLKRVGRDMQSYPLWSWKCGYDNRFAQISVGK